MTNLKCRVQYQVKRRLEFSDGTMPFYALLAPASSQSGTYQKTMKNTYHSIHTGKINITMTRNIVYLLLQLVPCDKSLLLLHSFLSRTVPFPYILHHTVLHGLSLLLPSTSHLITCPNHSSLLSWIIPDAIITLVIPHIISSRILSLLVLHRNIYKFCH